MRSPFKIQLTGDLIMPFSPQEMTPSTLKGMVHRLQKKLAELPQPSSWPPKQSVCQEWIARALNFQNWHEAIEVTQNKTTPHPQSDEFDAHPQNSEQKPAHPFLRIFSEHKPTFNIYQSTFFIMDESLLTSLFESCQTPHTLLIKNHPLTEQHHHSISIFTVSLLEWWLARFQISDIPHLADMLLYGMGEENPMWKNRTLSMCSIALEIEFFKRKNQPTLAPLSLKEIPSICQLESLIQCAQDQTFPFETLEKLNHYLFSIPDYSNHIKSPSQTTLQMHGYLEGQVSRIWKNVFIPNDYLKTLNSFVWHFSPSSEIDFSFFSKVFKFVFPLFLKNQGIQHLMVENCANHPFEKLLLSVQDFLKQEKIGVWWGCHHIHDIQERSSFLNSTWFKRVVSMGPSSPFFEQSLSIIDQEQLLTLNHLYLNEEMTSTSEKKTPDKKEETLKQSSCYFWSCLEDSFKTRF